MAAELRRATINNILGAIVAAAEARSADDATLARLIFDAMAQGGYHDRVGNKTRKTLPHPSSLSTSIRPPFASTADRAMARPSPIPPALLDRPASTR